MPPGSRRRRQGSAPARGRPCYHELERRRGHRELVGAMHIVGSLRGVCRGAIKSLPHARDARCACAAVSVLNGAMESRLSTSRVRDWAKGYAYLAHGTVRRTPILSKPVEGSLCDSRPEERGRCEHA
jgi:hypothetical protein